MSLKAVLICAAVVCAASVHTDEVVRSIPSSFFEDAPLERAEFVAPITTPTSGKSLLQRSRKVQVQVRAMNVEALKPLLISRDQVQKLSKHQHSTQGDFVSEGWSSAKALVGNLKREVSESMTSSGGMLSLVEAGLGAAAENAGLENHAASSVEVKPAAVAEPRQAPVTSLLEQELGSLARMEPEVIATPSKQGGVVSITLGSQRK